VRRVGPLLMALKVPRYARDDNSFVISTLWKQEEARGPTYA
jgi:hypothetical protein